MLPLSCPKAQLKTASPSHRKSPKSPARPPISPTDSVNTMDPLIKGPRPPRSRIAVFGDKNKPKPRPGFIKDLAQILTHAQPDDKKGKKPIPSERASPTNDDLTKMTALDPKLINTRTLRPKALFSEVQQPCAHKPTHSDLHSHAEPLKSRKKELELTVNSTTSGQDSS